ncbi:MAG: hypothetical protein EPN64_13075 [Burkholderiaceae bacterium]|nr:MAG: hypothetical protein EPN64_13075 [Burkholderiaceae bacterium]
MVNDKETFISKVARRWIVRREEQQLKSGTVKHCARQLEFFIGAFAAAEELGMPQNSAGLIILAVGRDAKELIQDAT